GRLARVGIDAFAAAGTEPALVLAMCAVYIGGRRRLPRYAVILVVATGLAMAFLLGRIDSADLAFAPAVPHFVAPTFSVPALIGGGLPLFVATMASRNVPGVAVLTASGYRPPISPLTAWTGPTTLPLAPSGAYAGSLPAAT